MYRELSLTQPCDNTERTGAVCSHEKNPSACENLLSGERIGRDVVCSVVCLLSNPVKFGILPCKERNVYE